MSNITKYATTAEYEAATLDKPAVTLTQDDGEVHFNDESYVRIWSTDGTDIIFMGNTYKSGEKIIVGAASRVYFQSSTLPNTAKIDASLLDLSSCTSCSQMFFYNWNAIPIKYLDCRNWDVSKVTRMDRMFQNCSGLTALDVSNFDTSACTNMGYMFNGCYGLTSLDVSNFDTSACTNMDSMFNGCYGLTSLDVSNFDTSACTYMGGMFYNCTGLTSLDVSNFDTSACTYMGYMFRNCSGLTSLDVSNWNLSKLTSMQYAFTSCSKLTSLDFSNSGMTALNSSMQCTFEGCSSLETLNLSGCSGTFTSCGWWSDGTFCGCSKIKELDISGFDLSACTTPGSFCRSCTSLEKVILGNQDWSNWNTGGMNAVSSSNNGSGSTDYHPFYYDTKLTTLEGTISNLGKCYYDYAWTVSYRLFLCCPLTEASALIVLNGLYDMTGSSSVLTMIFSKTTYDLLTEDDLAIATNKNWLVTYDSNY